MMSELQVDNSTNSSSPTFKPNSFIAQTDAILLPHFCYGKSPSFSFPHRLMDQEAPLWLALSSGSPAANQLALWKWCEASPEGLTARKSGMYEHLLLLLTVSGKCVCVCFACSITIHHIVFWGGSLLSAAESSFHDINVAASRDEFQFFP